MGHCILWDISPSVTLGAKLTQIWDYVKLVKQHDKWGKFHLVAFNVIGGGGLFGAFACHT